MCRLANVLKAMGVKKGDRVTIYLPMIPEAAYAMLACARIGAPHSVVFGGFSPDSLADRVNGAESKLIITSDGGLRGGRAVPLKVNADKALEKCPPDVKVLMFRHTGMSVPMVEGRDFDAGELMKAASADCPAEPMNAEDPLFLLYTSGSTGKPKGALHTTGGYLVYAALTHEYVFDYRDGDVYWCTADVGWVTGHSYILYGPLANGATTLMFEGIPTYPEHLAVLGRRRQAPGDHLLHRAHGDPLPDAEGRRAGEEELAQIIAPVGLGRRADQSRGLEVVSPRRRRGPLPDRRHLVADRDRRHPDHAPCPAPPISSPAPRRGRSSASSRPWSTMTATCWRVRPRAIWSSSTPGPA